MEIWPLDFLLRMMIHGANKCTLCLQLFCYLKLPK